MTTFLVILLVLAAGATLFVLVKGVIGMAQGKDITGQRSQELMRKRVMFQAIAIILVILLAAGRRRKELSPGPAQQDLHAHRRRRRDRAGRRLAPLQGRSALRRDRRRRRGQQRDRPRPPPRRGRGAARRC